MTRILQLSRAVLMVFLLFYGLSSANAQTKIKISGHVTDQQGEPMIGIQVVPIGSPQSGGLTDLDGNYSINIPNTVKELSFSYVGYKTQKVFIKGRKRIDIVLREDNKLLDQVVVTGYSSQARSRMTTSIAKLDTKSLASAPRSNVATALQGSIPGLKVSTTSGQPGQTPNMVLRGGTSFDGSGSPLVLVDGVPSSFYALNPDDVASIEVLKDAASTAIYGARAANGVILVTTKKGKAGTSRITFRTKLTYNARPVDPMEYLGAKDYVKFNRLGIQKTHEIFGNKKFQAFLTGGNGAGTGNNTTNSIYTTMYLTPQNKYLLEKGNGWLSIPDPLDPTKTLIFQDNKHSDLFYQNSHAEDYSISFEGGNDKGTYYLGLGALNDKGLVMGASFKRYSATFNGSYKITDRIKVSSSVMYIHSNQKNPFDSLYNLFQRGAGQAPTTRIWYTTPEGPDSCKPHPGTNFGFGNPLYYNDKRPRSNLEQRLSANAQLDFKLTDKVTLSAKGSHFALNSSNEQFAKSYIKGSGQEITKRASYFNYDRTLRNQLTLLARYSDTFAEKHHISALGGWEWFEQKYFKMEAATRLAPTDLIPSMNAGAEAEGKPSSQHTEYAIASLLGQVNYDYDMRYLIGLTFRYDGTSRLGDNKWGFFPGASIGWNVHNEAFYKDSKLRDYISTIKPRLSYGVNGNIEVLGNYTVQGKYEGTPIYDSKGGYVNTALPNPTLLWERSKTLNFGLDLGLFNGRVSMMTDFFIRNVEDKLAGQKLAKWTGFSSITTNNGVIQNRGIEFQLNAELLKLKDFSWNMGLNLTHIVSYAKKLPFNGIDKNRQGGREIFTGNGDETIYVGGNQEGERLGYDLVTAYQYDGIYRTQADIDAHKGRIVEFAYNKDTRYLGDTRWKDINGDNKIDSRDRVVIGRTTPKLIGGINTDINYKGFSLYVKTDFAIGHYLVNGRRIKGLAQTQGNQNGPVEIANSWTPENPNTDVPRYDFTDQQKNHRAGGWDQGDYSSSSSRTLEKGDYLAIREVTLSYNLNKPFLNNLVKGMRLYLTGSNLHYFTGYSGSLPEESHGTDLGRYPLPRTFTFGANLTF